MKLDWVLQPGERAWLTSREVERDLEALAQYWRGQGVSVAVQEGSAVLISNLRAWENLALPAWYHRGVAPDELDTVVEAAFGVLGYAHKQMADLLASMPVALSLGERREVQLVRDYLQSPELWLVDESWWRLSHEHPAWIALLEGERPVAILVVARSVAPAGVRVLTHWQEQENEVE